MTLRAHLLLVLLAATAFGAPLIFLNERWHAALELREAERGRESLTVLQLDHLLASFDRFLVTYDLVIYSRITYLAGDAQTQILGIRKDLQTLEDSPLVSLNPGEVQRIAGAFDEASRLLRAAQGRAPAEALPGISPVDQSLSDALSLLQAAAQRALSRAEESVRLLDRERRAQTFALIAFTTGYFAVIALLVVLASRRIERPVSILAQLAEHRVGSGTPVELADSGPIEFQNISNSMRRLIDSLESTVEQRTASLARRVQENEVTQHSLEETNLALQTTVDELRRAERALIQRAKLAALGEMIGGISHDFNNVLVPIVSYVEMLSSQPEMLEDERQELLKIIMTAANDAALIIRRFQAFSQEPTESNFDFQIDINALVEDSIAMTEPRWGRKGERPGSEQTIHVSTRLGDVPLLYGNKAEIRQAVVNLIFNAIDALPDGGKIEVATSVDAEQITIQVQDSGLGMSKEVLAECTDPFFSTKEGKGIGLGLAMVHRTALGHAGSLDVASSPGNGTTVRLTLARGQATETAADDDTAPAGTSRRVRVLVVDDEPTVRRAISDMVSRTGYEVESSKDPREALRRARERSYDVLITDLRMRHMSGLALAEEVRKASPRCLIFLLTAFVAEPEPELDFSSVDQILYKPITQRALGRAIERALSSRSPEPA